MISDSPVNVLNSKKSKTWQKHGKKSSGILLSDWVEQVNFNHKYLISSHLDTNKKSIGEMAEWSNALVC